MSPAQCLDLLIRGTHEGMATFTAVAAAMLLFTMEDFPAKIPIPLIGLQAASWHADGASGDEKTWCLGQLAPAAASPVSRIPPPHVVRSLTFSHAGVNIAQARYGKDLPGVCSCHLGERSVIRSWLSGKTLDRDFTFTGDEIMTYMPARGPWFDTRKPVAKGCVIRGKTCGNRGLARVC
jgi:hypothetical protein